MHKMAWFQVIIIEYDLVCIYQKRHFFAHHLSVALRDLSCYYFPHCVTQECGDVLPVASMWKITYLQAERSQ